MGLLSGKEIKREVEKNKNTNSVILMPTGDGRVASGDKQNRIYVKDV